MQVNIVRGNERNARRRTSKEEENEVDVEVFCVLKFVFRQI